MEKVKKMTAGRKAAIGRASRPLSGKAATMKKIKKKLIPTGKGRAIGRAICPKTNDGSIATLRTMMMTTTRSSNTSPMRKRLTIRKLTAVQGGEEALENKRSGLF